jgi:hypothetical protein
MAAFYASKVYSCKKVLSISQIVHSCTFIVKLISNPQPVIRCLFRSRGRAPLQTTGEGSPDSPLYGHKVSF